MIATVLLLAAAPAAQAVPAFAPLPSFAAQFDTDYPEPRACVSSQAWWLEGPGDATTSIETAMEATHLHYETCSPFMEKWNEASGTLRMDIQAQAHEYQGGTLKSVGALGFLDNGGLTHKFVPPWQPVTDNESKLVSLTRSASSITRCGRVEERNHAEAISPNGGERQFNSTGWQSLFDCKPGRKSAADRGPGIIFRGWYQGADYCNITFSDDFRGETGFRASQMDDPVVGPLKLKFGIGSCTNAHWLIMVNPDIHHGSLGSYHVNGTGTKLTVTIPGSEIPTGIFRVAAAACERVGVSAANPTGGQNCGVGVIPFLGD
jgi:hypothetical protein